MQFQQSPVIKNYNQKILVANQNIPDGNIKESAEWLHMLIVFLEEAIRHESTCITGKISEFYTLQLESKIKNFVNENNRRNTLDDDIRQICFIAQSKAYLLSVIVRGGNVSDKECGTKEFLKSYPKGILRTDDIEIYEYSMYDLWYQILQFTKSVKTHFWSNDHSKLLFALKRRAQILSTIVEKDEEQEIFDHTLFYEVSKDNYFFSDEMNEGESNFSDDQKKSQQRQEIESYKISEYGITFYERFFYYLEREEYFFKNIPCYDQSEVFKPPQELIKNFVNVICNSFKNISNIKSVDKLVCGQVTMWLASDLECENASHKKLTVDKTDYHYIVETQHSEIMSTQLRSCILRESGLVAIVLSKLKNSLQAMLNPVQEDIISSMVFLNLVNVWISSHCDSIQFDMFNYFQKSSNLKIPFASNIFVYNSDTPLILKMPHGWGVWDTEEKKACLYSNPIEASLVWFLGMCGNMHNFQKLKNFDKDGFLCAEKIIKENTQWEKKENLNSRFDIPYYEKEINKN